MFCIIFVKCIYCTYIKNVQNFLLRSLMKNVVINLTYITYNLRYKLVLLGSRSNLSMIKADPGNSEFKK